MPEQRGAKTLASSARIAGHRGSHLFAGIVIGGSRNYWRTIQTLSGASSFCFVERVLLCFFASFWFSLGSFNCFSFLCRGSIKLWAKSKARLKTSSIAAERLSRRNPFQSLTNFPRGLTLWRICTTRFVIALVSSQVPFCNLLMSFLRFNFNATF